MRSTTSARWLLLSALVTSGCERGAWPDLDSLDDLRVAFNGGRGETRIVLLLSPT